jgi:hypothetical protein
LLSSLYLLSWTSSSFSIFAVLWSGMFILPRHFVSQGICCICAPNPVAVQQTYDMTFLSLLAFLPS